jgi:mono/diheme cytochrome c family protein
MIIGFVAATLATAPVSGQSNEEDTAGSPVSTEAAFRSYCAPCHGEDGRGDGPLVSRLSRPPPDLTALTIRSGGTFPRRRVARLIDGREQLDAHSREMPKWGEWFGLEAEEGFEGEADDEANIQGRIDDLLDVLDSMQEPAN